MGAPEQLRPSSTEHDLVREALAQLGVKELLFAIHDASFPSDRDEDIGRGAPTTAAATRLLALVKRLGFTGVQLGPQGQTSRDNASPYDATIFSRSIETIPLSTFTTGALAGTVSDASLGDATRTTGTTRSSRADHERAQATMQRLLDEAFSALEHARGSSADRADAPEHAIVGAARAFRRDNAAWLERDALYAAIAAEEGGKSFRHWRADGDLFAQREVDEARRAALVARHARALDRYALGQLLAHDAHAAFRARANGLGLSIRADLQTGLSEIDRWGWRSLLLEGYAMGAPPSRTTPAGQPWGYPVLDPDKLWEPETAAPGEARAHGPALRLLALRFDKALSEYDGVRVDHPHGLVCPWVYRTDIRDPGEAVRAGARLYESPDLPDHPRLARYAVARPEQIDRTVARYADGWVTDLDPAQVDRYAVAIELLMAIAHRHGRGDRAVACEVLSTIPHPLARVLARDGLGRFRVVQKAKLDDPTDGYRPDNAEPPDWMMLGTHDTPSIWAVVRALAPTQRDAWARHLSAALRMPSGAEASLSSDPGSLAHAMLAEIFACRAENVLVYFTDLFGYEERYNEPGTQSPDNWSLRLPSSFEALYAERAARRAAIDLPLALAMALESRAGGGPTDLSRALRAVSASPGSRPGTPAPGA
jgi:4-alpha-glucanotransferase